MPKCRLHFNAVSLVDRGVALLGGYFGALAGGHATTTVTQAALLLLGLSPGVVPTVIYCAALAVGAYLGGNVGYRGTQALLTADETRPTTGRPRNRTTSLRGP